MRKLILMISLMAVLWPGRALGQEQVSLSHLQIDLWPEFDDPGMLVIYRMQLSAETVLPVRLTFRIPAAAGRPNAVAVGENAASVADTPYDYRINGSWGEVSFTALSPVIQLEYYDPALQKQGKARRFVYGWPGDYSVSEITISIQQPFGANGMRISPAFSESAVASDGLTYYTINAGEVRQGRAFTVSLDYEKDSDALTAEFLQVQPVTPLPATENRLDLWRILPWVLGGAGAVLLFGGVGWYFLSARGGRLLGTAALRRKRLSRPAAKPAASLYCQQCGTRAEAGDRFCRACGAALRVE